MIEIFKWHSEANVHTKYIFFSYKTHFLSISPDGGIVDDPWSYSESNSPCWIKLNPEESQEMKARYL